MIITMTEEFTMRGGRYSVLAYDDVRFWTMEREWNYNKPFESSVPKGTYRLEPHNGSKYDDTFALIGPGVSHFKPSGNGRWSCVFHSAVYPSDLAGCIAVGKSVNANGVLIDSTEVTKYFLADLNREDEHTLLIL